jgi:hypothetical protein
MEFSKKTYQLANSFCYNDRSFRKGRSISPSGHKYTTTITGSPRSGPIISKSQALRGTIRDRGDPRIPSTRYTCFLNFVRNRRAWLPIALPWTHQSIPALRVAHGPRLKVRVHTLCNSPRIVYHMSSAISVTGCPFSIYTFVVFCTSSTHHNALHRHMGLRL